MPLLLQSKHLPLVYIVLSNQYALAATESPHDAAQGILSSLPMLIAFTLIFYWLIIRPQKHRQQEHDKLIDSLKKGDMVTTIGGICGKITDIDTTNNTIALCVDEVKGVILTMERHTISKRMPSSKAEKTPKDKLSES